MNFDFDDEGRLVLPSKGSVKLNPYVPRQLKPIDYMSDAELQHGAGGVMLFDTECYPNYFLAAFKNYQTGKVTKLEPPFDPKKLSWILHAYMCVGFNSKPYDLPLLWVAYHNQNLELLKSASNDLVSGMYFREFEKQYNIQIFPTPNVDLIEVCPLRGSLKLYGARLHSDRIQDLPFYHMDPLEPWQKEVVADYCINNDLPATGLLLTNLKEQLDLRGELSKQYQQDLMSKSDAQIAEAVISSELKNITGKWPKKPKINTNDTYSYQKPTFISFQSEALNKALNVVVTAQYGIQENGRLIKPKEIQGLTIPIGKALYRIGSGGLHSSETNVAVKADDEYELIDRDVASYYPAIVLNLGLYPKHLGPDFLTVYKTLVDRRLAAKKAKNIAIAECLKITINGTFGKTGSPYSALYAPEMMIQITITGQLSLLMLIEQMELNGIEVVSANTDGFVMRVHKSQKDKMNEIIVMWEKLTGFVTEETKYKAVYSRDVNAYMAIKENNEVKGKNVYYDPWRGKTAKDGYWRFQKNPNAQICVEAVEAFITNGTPIEKTITDCKEIKKFVCVKNVTGGAHKDNYYLGKVVRWYYAHGIEGTINRVTNNNKVPDTEGAHPAMDLPEHFPNNMNHDWYIAKAKEMLQDMAYLSKGRQIKFF